jgi:acetyltransferase-like isoleucine patch superfamily enzyme
LSGGKTNKEESPVVIGDCCYIGPMSIISKGVILGQRCVVAANSFVNKSFPDHSVIGGTPAKRLGEVIEKEDGTIDFEWI